MKTIELSKDILRHILTKVFSPYPLCVKIVDEIIDGYEKEITKKLNNDNSVDIELSREDAETLYFILETYGDGGFVFEKDSKLIEKIQSEIYKKIYE